MRRLGLLSWLFCRQGVRHEKFCLGLFILVVLREPSLDDLVDFDGRIAHSYFVELALEVTLEVVSVHDFEARNVVSLVGAFFLIEFESFVLHREVSDSVVVLLRAWASQPVELRNPLSDLHVVSNCSAHS